MEDLSRVSLRSKHLTEATVKLKDGQKLYNVPILFSHDGKWLFVSCGALVKVYSKTSRHVASVLEGHTAPITGLCLHDKNNLQLLSSSLDGQLLLWDYMDGAVLKRVDFGVSLLKFALGHGDQAGSMFFSVATGKEQVSIVGVSRACLDDRSPAMPPSEMLQTSPSLMSSRVAIDFHLTHQGRHLVSTTGTGRKLLVYNFLKEKNYRYKCMPRLTALASHPTRACVATGNYRGEIHLWYHFGEGDSVTKTTLHWHAHAVGHLCFTTDGTYLLSGGEEGVVVMWTIQTNQRHFRPRLGAPITRLACAPADAYFTVSLQSNAIVMLSGLSLEEDGLLGGLRQAWSSPKVGEVRTGLVLCPRNRSLVLNSSPGVLQFYDVTTQMVTELNVTDLNTVSRTEGKALVPTTVDHVAFSPTGDWMATVESRDDGETAPELRLKFWHFFKKWQKYTVMTCVEPPHHKRVTSLRFQPATSRSNPHSGSNRRWNGTGLSPVAVTTSVDGQFKMWVLVGGSGSEEACPDKKCWWGCHVTGHMRNLPALGCSFSQDASLLAVNFSQVVGVWCEGELQCRFHSLPQEVFSQIEFGSGTCSQYLLSTSPFHLQVWDLLSCAESWRVALCAPSLVVSPLTSVVAVFSKRDDVFSVYQIDPSSPSPLSVHDTGTHLPIIGGVYVPGNTCGEGNYDSREVALYFMDSSQVLYSLERRLDEFHSGSNVQPSRAKLLPETTSRAQQALLSVIGKRKRLNGLHPVNRAGACPPPSEPPSSLSMFSVAPHVLPSSSNLCPRIMTHLLPPRLPYRVEKVKAQGVSDDSNGLDFSKPSENLMEQKRTCASHEAPPITDSVVRTCSSEPYSWLVGYFQSNS